MVLAGIFNGIKIIRIMKTKNLLIAFMLLCSVVFLGQLTSCSKDSSTTQTVTPDPNPNPNPNPNPGTTSINNTDWYGTNTEHNNTYNYDDHRIYRLRFGLSTGGTLTTTQQVTYFDPYEYYEDEWCEYFDFTYNNGFGTLYFDNGYETTFTVNGNRLILDGITYSKQN